MMLTGPSSFDSNVLNKDEQSGVDRNNSRAKDDNENATDGTTKAPGEAPPPESTALAMIPDTDMFGMGSCQSLEDVLGPDALTPTRGGNGIMRVFSRASPRTKRKWRQPYISKTANEEFLGNYFYCSNEHHEREAMADNVPRMYCVGCDVVGCGGLEGVFATADHVLSLQKRKQAHRETSTASTLSVGLGAETWFEAATERFDDALDRFVWQSRKPNRWSPHLQAPSLNIRTPPTSSCRRFLSKPGSSKEGTADRPMGIVTHDCHPQTPHRPLLRREHSLGGGSVDSSTADAQMTNVQFEFIYGVSRAEFKLLPESHQGRLKDDVAAKRGDWIAQGGLHLFDVQTESPSPPRSSPKRRHRTTFSTSDVGFVEPRQSFQQSHFTAPSSILLKNPLEVSESETM